MGDEEEKPSGKSSVPEEGRKEKVEGKETFAADEAPPPSLDALKAAEELYQKFLTFTIQEIFEKAKSESFFIEGRNIRAAVEPVVDVLQKGDAGLLYFATTHSTPDYYLHAHAVNTCIFSVALGVSLGYEREALITLAMGALLHDLGMIKVMDVAQVKRKLTIDEKQAIETHVRYNVDLLKSVQNLPEKCIVIAQTVHERPDGHGYPLGLPGEALSEEAQLVALCDIYEALTHPRSYRDRLSPYEALKEILKGKELFNQRLLKLILQQLTIFPIGCWVELSTGEQGQVIRTNPNAPLRPTLQLFFDNQKRKLTVPRLVDLKNHATLFVKRSLEQKEIQEKG